MGGVRLDHDVVEAAVLGGAVLGGGGGGSMAEGRRHALLAIEMGEPELIDADDLAPDAVLVTVSAVGSPSARTAKALPVHYVRAVELLARETRVDGVITNECGGLAAVNGWLRAAALGIPVVDAPCNGRAHPTGVMGSLGLHRVPGYVSRQAAVEGDPQAGTYVEMAVRGSLERAAALVRQASVQAEGMVAVARNPVSVSYAREHAAVGAIRQVLAVGRAMLEAQGQGPLAMVEAACAVLGGEVLGKGRVTEVRLETRRGFDVGRVVVQPAAGPALELDFWNEYAACDRQGERLATFPDLLATFDLSSGLPLSSAEVAAGQEVAVVWVPRQHLILGAGMRDPDLMRPLEQATGKEIVRCWNSPCAWSSGGGRLVGADGPVGSRLLELLGDAAESRNLAELGVGTNDKARVSGVVLEDEKIYGTVHVAFGDNSTFGGKTRAGVHIDAVVLRPDLYLDDRLVVSAAGSYSPDGT